MNVEYLINRLCEYWLMNQDKHGLQIASLSFRSGCLVRDDSNEHLYLINLKISNQGYIEMHIAWGDYILTN